MAMRGTKPQTAAQQKLAGNPGKRPPRKEPKTDGKAPVCPGHLDAEGKREWRRLVRWLRGLGLLASSDVAIMTLYCDTWSEYVVARKLARRFAEQGDGLSQFVLISKEFERPFINSLFNVQCKLKLLLERFLGELGLSPVSRARVHTEGSASDDDPLVALIRQRAERFGEN